MSRIHLLTDGADHTTAALRSAVAHLTAAADPGRAERLRPRAGEAPALVARLAAWAVHQVDGATIEQALAILDADRDGSLMALLDTKTAVPCC